MIPEIGHFALIIALLVAVVQSESLAKVTPGGAVVAFGAVVVLTMLATLSFDPRLIWDALSEPKKELEKRDLKN